MENVAIVSQNTTKRDLWNDRRKVVLAVAKAYQFTAALPALSGSNIDPCPTSRSSKWTPASAHFIADVESTIRKALAGNSDVAELLAAWNQLVDDENGSNVISSTAKRLIMLLGPWFIRNGLEPRLYFKPSIRKGGVHRRTK